MHFYVRVPVLYAYVILFFSITYVQYAYFTPARWRTVDPWLLTYTGYWNRGASRSFSYQSVDAARKGELSGWWSLAGDSAWVTFSRPWHCCMVGWHEGHPVCENPLQLSSKFRFKHKQRKKLRGNLENKVRPTMVFVLLVISQGSNKIHHNQSKHTINVISLHQAIKEYHTFKVLSKTKLKKKQPKPTHTLNTIQKGQKCERYAGHTLYDYKYKITGLLNATFLALAYTSSIVNATMCVITWPSSFKSLGLYKKPQLQAYSTSMSVHCWSISSDDLPSNHSGDWQLKTFDAIIASSVTHTIRLKSATNFALHTVSQKRPTFDLL